MIIKKLFLFLIRLYRRWVSPIFPPVCRFFPTCSCYAAQAIDKYGVVKGTVLSFRRIIKCHPFNTGGYDPVP